MLVRGEAPETLQCADGYPHADTPDALRAFAEGWRGESPPDPGWLVIRARDGLAIGEIGFGFEVEPGVLTGGYGFAAVAWGRGYASEALTTVLTHVLGQPGAKRVVAEALRSNVASWRVMEKAGMRFVRELEREEGGTVVAFVEYAMSR